MERIVYESPEVVVQSLPPQPSVTTSRRRSREGGPPLLLPAVAFAGLTIAVAVLGWGTPRPAASAAEVFAYTAGHPTSIRIGAALLLGSTFPLVICAVTLYRRLRRLGVSAPGPLMGVAGALLAATALAASALFSWTATQSVELGDPALVRALTTLSFAAGGVGFVAPFGLLVAGIAVPALILRLLHTSLAWTGLVIAGLAILSTLALISDALYPLLPLGRFGGLLFLIAAAGLLPRSVRTPL